MSASIELRVNSSLQCALQELRDGVFILQLLKERDELAVGSLQLAASKNFSKYLMLANKKRVICFVLREG